VGARQRHDDVVHALLGQRVVALYGLRRRLSVPSTVA
jgi:hypothetical protein